MPGKHDLSESEPEQDDDAVVTSPSSSSKRRSRRKTKHTEEEEEPPRSSPPPQDDEEEEDEVMSDIEEQDQEALDRMKQTQQLKSDNHKIAESGVITHVKLENFMCHYSTEVDFGPQVNFLVGVNGSGKSAVLTGITMALGGNAKATNRGTKGGDLIREGQSSARCSVTLANRGEESFKPDVYGEEITIERTINKAGGGNYKIKNDQGKTVDTKKSTLDSILDHFNLQVDNPMTVLTQDQSRQFLAKASARDKYNFFLRGTQLAQLTEEYEQIRSNTETMEEALSRKKEVLPELKEAYKRAKDRAKEAQAAIEQEGNLVRLKNQVIWSYVEEVEDQIKFARKQIDDEEKRGKKFEDEINQQQGHIDRLNLEVETAKEAEAESKNAVDQNKPDLAALQEKIRKNKLRLQNWKDSERKINAELKRKRETVKDLEERIQVEVANLSRDIEAERAPLRAAIELAQDEISKIDLHVTRNEEIFTQAAEDYRKHSEEYSNYKSQIQNAQNQIHQANSRLQQIKGVSSNKLTKFGQNMPQLVQAIQNERNWRGKVIGPMGLHVELLQPDYAKVLESFFAHYLNGFVVEFPEDSKRLRQLMKLCRLPEQTMVLCTQFDPKFENDLVHGEPHNQIPTILRALNINDPLVRQALINANQIEKIALVPRRPDGDNLMRGDPRNVTRAFSADMYQLRHSNGRSSSTSMDEWRGAPRLTADPTRAIAGIEDDIRRISQDIQELEGKKYQAGQAAQAAEQKRRNTEGELRKLQQRKRRLENEIATKTEKLTEEQPNNISALESSKQEIVDEIDNISAQYQAGLEKKEAEDIDIGPDVERMNQLNRDINQAESLAKKINDHLATLYSSITTYGRNLARAKTEKENHLAKLHGFRAELERSEETLQERLEQASSICERPENPSGKRKTPERLQREIEAIERALKERAKRQGATVEQIIEEMRVRKKVAQEAVKQTNELGTLINQLEKAYENRTSKWTDFRSHICQRARMQFGYYLSNRGFHGKLKFDHDRTQLHLAVQTDADKGKEKQKRKDAAALSGGEKSFSTICLLLTMWEAVGCPLRCLDEFDVFMDAVNRRIAMSMMIDTAKSADQTQFILITPQDMGSISWGKEVKVVKMGDPKRAAGTLAAGR
ncbi:hypothetical protein JCM3765_005693 [Sporobolomyces pararoseus]